MTQHNNETKKIIDETIDVINNIKFVEMSRLCVFNSIRSTLPVHCRGVSHNDADLRARTSPSKHQLFYR